MELTGCVADVRKMFLPSLDSANLAVYKAAGEILNSRPQDFARITLKDGTPIRCTVTFLDEEFFQAVTTAAYASLAADALEEVRIEVDGRTFGKLSVCDPPIKVTLTR